MHGIYIGLKRVPVSLLWGLCICYNETWTLWVRPTVVFPLIMKLPHDPKGSKYPNMQCSSFLLPLTLSTPSTPSNEHAMRRSFKSLYFGYHILILSQGAGGVHYGI